MAVQVRPAHSKAQINRAGDTLRKALAREPLEVEELFAAFEMLAHWRACHAYPLQKATMGLRSVCKTELTPVKVSQRLKREPTMVDKLARFPKMQLARMTDIAGCRAVFHDVGELRRVQKRLSRNRPPLNVKDYIERPKDSGYRGLHVIVKYDDFPIEVQLRTAVQHEWAVTVERFGSRLGTDLKSGVGPPEVLDFFHAVSEALELEERGERVDEVLEARIASLRRSALNYAVGGTPQ